MGKKKYMLLKNNITCPNCGSSLINSKYRLSYSSYEGCKCTELGITGGAQYSNYYFNLFNISQNKYYGSQHGIGISDIRVRKSNIRFKIIYSIGEYSEFFGSNSKLFYELVSSKYSDKYFNVKDEKEFINKIQTIINDLFLIKENLIFA